MWEESYVLVAIYEQYPTDNPHIKDLTANIDLKV